MRKYALLVDRHKDRAFTLALRLVQDREEAEELVQDAFVRAYRSLEQFRGDAKFSTWLYRIVYNLCMTRVTRRKARPEFLDYHQEETHQGLFADNDEAGVDEQIENEDFRKILLEEVSRLPEHYRAAVGLFYLQEMSYEEMTNVLQLPLGTVKTNLFRARNLLRERMSIRLKGEIA
ncbi:MAG: sigma-70 family RNA polymerase sigma factor [Bacteroidetes bacterium]|nr:sigma-70 family RNA polymerase sigma factor [Bacteroidota bacterium]MCW5897302.1 sigma-70 family RNA polymerase sigma factor [Bacteroidota bacterium]